MGEHTVEFTDANFETEVINSDVPVLVDLWAEWCNPCRMMSPTIDELAEEYQGKVKIGKMNTEENRETPTKLGISAIPTLLLYKDGEIAKTMVGVTPKKDLAAALDEVL